MATIDSANSVALQLMLQASRASGTGTSTANQPDLVPTVLGNTNKNTVAVERQPSQAQSNVTDASLKVIAQKENERKVQLIKAFGQAFGVNEDSFTSNFDYVQAVSNEIDRIKGSPNGQDTLDAVTNKLGLNKLGVSTDSMLTAILLPSSDEGKQLDSAIANEFDVAGKQKLSKLQHASETLVSVEQDADGTYRPALGGPETKKSEDHDAGNDSAS